MSENKDRLAEVIKTAKADTDELVRVLKEECRSRDFAEGYIFGVSLNMPDVVREYAHLLFEEIWPPEPTAG